MTGRADDEKGRMLRGELYRATDPVLVADRLRARRLLKAFNDSDPDDAPGRAALLGELFGAVGRNLLIEPPFRCDYGWNIEVGDDVFMNFGCIVLDVAPVRIGDRVLLGPQVQLYAATHPLDARTRADGLESGRPIRIGDDVWMGGGAIVGPGLSIGARSVIGAGSVVTRDVPSDVFAAGNPCRVIRVLRPDEPRGPAEDGAGNE